LTVSFFFLAIQGYLILYSIWGGRIQGVKLGKYRHYKGNFYNVIGVAKHSETLEELVVYESLYANPEGKLWVRPKHMFIEEVEIGGKKVPRFEFVGD
jgi:hypothetical protein